MDKVKFASRDTVEQIEEGYDLAPKFGPDGLRPCITSDARSGQALRCVIVKDSHVVGEAATARFSCVVGGKVGESDQQILS
ncbi:hypothetical protein [Roseovarius sp.]|uniref:hypothetical protein n=1 Tax=Roseovarius sp. TaxID=1486281 RepID=UPI003D0A1FC7